MNFRAHHFNSARASFITSPAGNIQVVNKFPKELSALLLVQFEDISLNVGQCTCHRLCPLRRRPQFYREASLYVNECKGLPRPEAAPMCQDWFATSIFSRGEVP